MDRTTVGAAQTTVERSQRQDAESLFLQVYDDLRSLADRFMRHERRNHTLDGTAVVHEAYLRLLDQKQIEWRGRSEFFAIAARVIRQILIEHARKHAAVKRGGGAHRCGFPAEIPDEADSSAVDLLALDEALSRLARLSERQSQIVELRYFAGLGVADVARILGVCPRTVKGEWQVARAWLRGQLDA